MFSILLFHFRLEDSPQKKNMSNILAPGDYAYAVCSPNVSYALSSADEYGSPAYRGINKCTNGL